MTGKAQKIVIVFWAFLRINFANVDILSIKGI